MYFFDVIIMLSSSNMLGMIRFKYNVIIPVIFSHSDLSVQSKQYHNHIENVISSLFYLLLSFRVLEHKIGISFHDGTGRKIV